MAKSWPASSRRALPDTLRPLTFALYGTQRLGERLYQPAGQACSRPRGQTHYELTDHLGNVRVVVSDAKRDTLIGQSLLLSARVLSAQDYYPFGLKVPERQVQWAGGKYRWGYQGSELDKLLGEEHYTTEYRTLDTRIARWSSIDPERDNMPWQSPYNSMDGNPILKNDPDGDCPNCITGAIGAGVGALLGGGIEASMQLYNTGSISNWRAVGGAALQGGITGGVAGLTGGLSLVASAGAAGLANVAGGAANRAIQGQNTSAADVALDGAIGLAGGAAGKAVGAMVTKATDKLSRHTKGKLGEAITKVKYGLRGYKDGGKAIVETGKKTPKRGADQLANYDHAMKNRFTGKELTVESKFGYQATLSPNQKAARSKVQTPGGLIVEHYYPHQVGAAAQGSTAGAVSGAGSQTNRKK